MRILVCISAFLILTACAGIEGGVQITETDYEGRPHFLVQSKQVSYFFDQAGGGFSRIIDKEGNDWINFKMNPWGTYPDAAASSFRGIPNLVFQGKDDGAGHPGHEKCSSRVEENRIITESKSGLWKWSWEFYENYAVLDIVKTDPERAYWFLYEGTPGGSFRPGESYFGSDKAGPVPARHDYFKGNILWDHFRWMYAGSRQSDCTLFLIQEKEDDLMDMISFLGNSKAGIDSHDGMTVFGFGRDKEATPLMSGTGKFIIGIYPHKIESTEEHSRLSSYIEELFLK